MRLFVALELPDDARGALAGWAAGAVADEPFTDGGSVKRSRERVRHLPAEALHVTLCFLGEHAGEAVAAIGSVLSVTAADVLEPVVLRSGPVLWLPPRRPRVCAVGLSDSGGRAGVLQARLAAALGDGGWYAGERRPWLPHVTVARIRSGASAASGGSAPGSVAAARAARAPSAGPPAPLRAPQLCFSASALTLFRSHPGSRYEPLTRIALPG